jgi:hypothetical protein
MFTREKFIHCLTTEWDTYLKEFEQKTDVEQRSFLAHQGYPRFADLLAHFTAWWYVGMQVIRHHQTDPDYQHPALDVDAFNNPVIQKVRETPDADVRVNFETVRAELIRFVKELSDTEVANPKINRQLRIEVVDHLREHEG